MAFGLVPVQLVQSQSNVLVSSKGTSGRNDTSKRQPILGDLHIYTQHHIPMLYLGSFGTALRKFTVDCFFQLLCNFSFF